MRVVVAALPVPGHWQPLVPLALALREAGHEVTVATGPGAADRLESLGWDVERIDAVPDAEAGQVMRSDPAMRALPLDQRWRFGLALFTGALADRVVEQLGAVLAARPADLVVYEEMDVGAAVAAGTAGVPAVRHSIGPGVVPGMQDGFVERLTERWQRAGRTPPPPQELFGRLAVDIWPQVLRRPDVAEPPLPVAPMRLQAWDDPGSEVPRWLTRARTRPVVHVALPAGPPAGPDLLRAVLDGLSGLDVEVLVDAGPGLDPAALGPVDDRVHLERSVPLAALELVDAVVHPGGAVLTLGSVDAGLPQLVLPQRVQDEFLNGAAVAAAGAGSTLVPGQQAAQAVQDGVRRLLEDPSAREGAQQLGKEVATMPSPEQVVPQLEALTT